MILVMSGTSDGNELAAAIQSRGLPVIVTVTSAYGEALALEQGLSVHTGKLDTEALVELVRTHQVRLLVDATHPYAAQASLTAMEAAKIVGIPCLRYERPLSAAGDESVTAFSSIETMRDAVEKEKGNILLTLGSNQLHHFKDVRNLKNLFVRILPVPALIETSLEYGFRSDHILAMQGPFSEAFNEALIRQWDIAVLVTKDSAGPGGFSEKLQAVRNTGIRLFLLQRPEISYTHVYRSLKALLDVIGEIRP